MTLQLQGKASSSAKSSLASDASHSIDVTRLQHARGFDRQSQLRLEITPYPTEHRIAGGEKGIESGVRKTASIALAKSGLATGAAITAARLFGLDAGDWAMIFVGLALSALLFAVA
jgi:hypothetical protein